MRSLPKIFAAAAFCTTAALAQNVPPPDKAEMQKRFAEMCTDRQAHAVGEIAYLEAKLALTDKQKPLFERWKKIKLAAAKANDCTPPQGEPSIMDGLKREEKRLQARLGELKAEMPALEALLAALSDDQKHAFAPHRGEPFGRPGRGPDHEGPPPPAY